MEFKWQHPEYLLLGPALFIMVLIASVLFHQWRKKAWNILGLDTKTKQPVSTRFGSMRFFTRHVLLAMALVFRARISEPSNGKSKANHQSKGGRCSLCA